MSNSAGKRHRWVRLMMVVNSFAPLFLLWAIKGESPFPEATFLVVCALAIVVPLAFIVMRIATARAIGEAAPLDIGEADDGRDHLLVYLFAMLLPFYAPNLTTWRSFSAVLVALAFVLFLFWYMNLHYVNVLFAVTGYRIYTIRPTADGNPISGVQPLVLITKRASLYGINLIEDAIPLSDTVYLEYGEDGSK